MIDYIAGPIAELSPTGCVIDCSGVGYEVAVTLLDYPRLQNVNNAKLYVHEAIREDAHVLYGFLDRDSRSVFRLLISVSGVGPNTARLILSSLSVDQLQEAILSENIAILKGVKGIGARTAQRIIVDLKDKINISGLSLSHSTPAKGEFYADALSALVMLGFPKPQSEKVLTKIFSSNPDVSTEQAIKQALTML